MIYTYMCVRFMCVRFMSVRAGVHACVRAYQRASVCVHLHMFFRACVINTASATVDTSGLGRKLIR